MMQGGATGQGREAVKAIWGITVLPRHGLVSSWALAWSVMRSPDIAAPPVGGLRDTAERVCELPRLAPRCGCLGTRTGRLLALPALTEQESIRRFCETGEVCIQESL